MTSPRLATLTEFTAQLPDIETVNEVIAGLDAVMNAFDIRFYVIVRHPAFSRDLIGQVLAGRWPDGWPERYLSRNYVLVDPIVRYMGRSQVGFNWADAILAYHSDPDYSRMQRMMLDAFKHGLEGGYAFPVHGRGGLVGNISLSGRAAELKTSELQAFDTLAKYAFWRLQELAGSDEGTPSYTDPHLTVREKQILAFLGEGLTSNEIASELELSRHTVDWHTGSLQEKLQAKNRHHTIAIAFRLGLIS
ncbi:LuxR family transcriptional regulator [Hoeflea sp. WL0058]|uniref:LuxR family transcriptional regulator n=1 Tax=Flavimaribacter sediminis TaxID=2865987 RepID=A0AAE2ZVN7_9HYPH|nr:LuxR family transcriptional regulator [Flavimaribacter sediminis]MBW8640562.1 LuxR family transcriptional regulator [Flavimaribacter sediminis]